MKGGLSGKSVQSKASFLFKTKRAMLVSNFGPLGNASTLKWSAPCKNLVRDWYSPLPTVIQTWVGTPQNP